MYINNYSKISYNLNSSNHFTAVSVRNKIFYTLLKLYFNFSAEADNTTYRMKQCAAIQLTPDGNLTFLKINCSIELPYVCIRCDGKDVD